MPFKSPIRKRNYAKTRMSALYKARREANLCVDCGDPANGHRAHCVSCGERRSKRQAEKLARLRQGWRAFGVCLLCGTREAMPKLTYCGACSERQIEGKTKRSKNV